MGRCLGLDRSHLSIEESISNCPNVEFQLIDVFCEPARLKELASGCTALFVDIGGNRNLSSVVECVHMARELLNSSLRLFVVKSMALFAVCRSVQCEAFNFPLRRPDVKMSASAH